MDKLNFVRDGGRKMPPGFRFQPSEEEIVFQYLSRKTFSRPLPALVIPEFDVFTLDPWHLPGDSEQDMYFFSKANRPEGKSERATPSGFWKASSSSKQIHSERRVRVPIVGIRNSLVFYKYSANKNLRAIRTDWTMHQYCIALSQQNNSLVRIGEWSLWRIFLNKGSGNAEISKYHEMNSDADSSSSSSSPNYDPNIFTEVSSSTRII